MSKKLAGVMFTYRAVAQDYCFIEALQSMSGVCDHVFVCDAGSDDGTLEQLYFLELVSSDLTVLKYDKWHTQSGKEKLSYFTNLAIEVAEKKGYEYVLSVQADEVLHESSYHVIRKAVEQGAEGYIVSRINLWGSPYTQLNVPQERKPCSTEILRLAKAKYRAYDDAESLAAPANFDYVSDIRIYHAGFVRKREVMVEKIRHMQADVFGMTPDEKLKGMEVFDPWAWFDRSDVTLINEPLPKFMQEWAEERVYKQTII